ncbi:unnamed protein product [Nippostrongylus brasiliensis]|uniref:AB hydrolase-1 domain-containing protein n=1 Tax=Nippostrongylus brasiliensis TaxID=27835 RepID=A0A0N4Y5S9_NIPBR|nr:unnamed protein product [Nippostrongylus brasiliensis]
MVWAGICATGKTPLVFVEKATKIDAQFYQEQVFRRDLLPWAQERFGDNVRHLQRDWAPAHAAKSTMALCNELFPGYWAKDDTLPSGSRIGSVVAIHGAPGSHKDFKYIAPLLQERGIRFIGVNMPGFGLSPGDPRLQCDNFERDNFIHELIKRMDIAQPMVIMSHSRGTENATSVAARNIVSGL